MVSDDISLIPPSAGVPGPTGAGRLPRSQRESGRTDRDRDEGFVESMSGV